MKLFVFFLLSIFFIGCQTFPSHLVEIREEARQAILEILIENAMNFYSDPDKRSTYRGANERPGVCIDYSAEFALMWNERYSHLGTAEIVIFSRRYLAPDGGNYGYGINGRFKVHRVNEFPGDPELGNVVFSANHVVNNRAMILYGISPDRQTFYRFDRQEGSWPGHPYWRTQRWVSVKMIDMHSWVAIFFGEFHAAIEPYWIDLCWQHRCRHCTGPRSYFKMEVSNHKR
jgi:hypothetical protein